MSKTSSIQVPIKFTCKSPRKFRLFKTDLEFHGFTLATIGGKDYELSVSENLQNQMSKDFVKLEIEEARPVFKDRNERLLYAIAHHNDKKQDFICLNQNQLDNFLSSRLKIRTFEIYENKNIQIMNQMTGQVKGETRARPYELSVRFENIVISPLTDDNNGHEVAILVEGEIDPKITATIKPIKIEAYRSNVNNKTPIMVSDSNLNNNSSEKTLQDELIEGFLKDMKNNLEKSRKFKKPTLDETIKDAMLNFGIRAGMYNVKVSNVDREKVKAEISKMWEEFYNPKNNIQSNNQTEVDRAVEEFLKKRKDFLIEFQSFSKSSLEEEVETAVKSFIIEAVRRELKVTDEHEEKIRKGIREMWNEFHSNQREVHSYSDNYSWRGNETDRSANTSRWNERENSKQSEPEGCIIS